MSWAVGWDSNWYRDIGYGVPAYCDQPGCGAEIDRGLGYVCGGEPYGGEKGCGLYFCEDHRDYAIAYDEDEDDPLYESVCDRCREDRDPHEPKPDHPKWIAHKLTDSSWGQWRAENPQQVSTMRGGAA